MRRLSSALLVVLLVPMAQAAATLPVAGHIESAHPWRADGVLSLSSAHASMDLVPALEHGEPIHMSWLGGEIQTVSYDVVRNIATQSGLAYEGVAGHHSNATERLPAAASASIRCGENCVAFLYTRGGRLNYTGRVASDLVTLPQPRVVRDGMFTGSAPDTFYYEIPAGGIGAGPGTAIATESAVATGFGDFGLMVTNCTLTVHNDAGDVTYSYIPHEEPAHDYGPLSAAVYHYNTSFAILNLNGVSLDGAALSFFANESAAKVEGSLGLPGATGTMTYGGSERRFHDSTLNIVGNIDLSLATSDFPLAVVSHREESDLAGAASEVRVDGASVEPALLSAREIETASGVGLLGVAGALILLARFFGLAPFYSRIDRAKVLANPNRKAIYEAVRGANGLSVAHLAKVTRISRVVVRHHIAILVAHNYVLLTDVGGHATYVAPEGALTKDEIARVWVLRDETRRRVAALVAGQTGGITQKQAVEALSISQRLASYHLSKLEAGGLVARVGASPQRYVPEPVLESLLRASAS